MILDYIQVTVLTTTACADAVSEQLIEAGSQGVMIEDKNDVSLNQRPEGQWDIIDEEIALRIGDDVRVSGFYAADERARDVLMDVRARIERLKGIDLGADPGKLEVLTSSVDDEDWAEYWKKQYQVMRLSERIVIRPGWLPYEAQPKDIVLTIDPGMAFGTGTHETTALCVELVEERVKPGDAVLDIGTGTGILAIAAAKLQAKEVLAIDIDPVAVRVAKENVALNGVVETVRAEVGNLLDGVDMTADVVIANIIADVIIMIATPVREHLKDGGTLICSGIARERRQGVVEALNACGYRDMVIRDRGEWCAIAVVK